MKTMNWTKQFIHNLAHLFNLNYGKTISWIKNDEIYVGFKCNTCGKVEGIHKAPNQYQ